MGETIGLREVTARVGRECLWCKDGIQPGEQYRRWMYKDGGDATFMATHAVCFNAIERIRIASGERYSDEFPCERNDHARGMGCYDCDPDRGVTGE